MPAPSPLLRLALVLFVAAGASVARAQGVTAQLNPTYNLTSTDTRDETGRTLHTDTSVVEQKYRLTLDQQFAPLLSLSAGGFLDWTQGASRIEGVTTDVDDKRWNVFGRLRFGSPLLGGGLDYDHRDEVGDSRTLGVSTPIAGVVREIYAGNVGWHPVDLPSLDLRLSHASNYDHDRRLIDSTTDTVLLSSRYLPDPDLDLRYSVQYTNPVDHLTEVSTTDLVNTAVATYSRQYLGGRGNLYLSYNLSSRNSTTTTHGLGGTVSVQQLPVVGLSIVESAVSLVTPVKVTLNPNAALIDGDTNTSAGLNIGFSAATGTIREYRDLGAQFPNAITPVNTIYVWVDKQIPADIASHFTWDVYTSDNNLDWTLFAPAASAAFSLIANRFEITFSQAQARYLKVVTRPLDPIVTTDRQFSEIFVTEIQFFQVVPASSVAGSRFTLGGTFAGTTKVLLAKPWNLTYDFSSFVTHTSNPTHVTYSLTNGFSVAERLTRVVSASARVDRTDSDQGTGHDSLDRWSGTLAANPIPTVGAGLNYSGQYQDRGSVLTNSASLFGRADLYEGLSLLGNASGSLAHDATGQTTRGATTSVSTTIVPNRVISLNGTLSYQTTEISGGNKPERTDRRGLLEGNVSYSPFPALAASAGVLWYFAGTSPTTLANFAGTLSPFRDGDLQFRYSYNESLDTANDLRTRNHGPSVRWNIRPAWLLDLTYSWIRTSSPAETQSSEAFFANLVITLR
jgi:hypothetical protein